MQRWKRIEILNLLRCTVLQSKVDKVGGWHRCLLSGWHIELLMHKPAFGKVGTSVFYRGSFMCISSQKKNKKPTKVCDLLLQSDKNAFAY